MATYSQNLAYIEQDEIPELYDFEYAGLYERYTSFSEDITFQGNLYTAATIKRTGFSQDTQFGRVSCSVQAPIIETLRKYISNQPIEVTRVTIYRALLSDLTKYVVLFKGDVLRVSVKGSIAQASCENQSHILSQKIPGIVYQASCNHRVFDDGCALAEIDWRVSATITAIDGYKYTAAAFDNGTANYFTGGTLIYNNDMRYITKQTDDDVWLHVPFDSRVAVGTKVWALPGCTGAPSRCTTRFNNYGKYQGFPYIPNRNPVMWGFK